MVNSSEKYLSIYYLLIFYPSLPPCSPIAPGEKFTYEFVVAQHGSYWIHSHFMGQYMDGLRTPFVVHAKNETYKYDHDVTIPFQGKYNPL